MNSSKVLSQLARKQALRHNGSSVLTSTRIGEILQCSRIHFTQERKSATTREETGECSHLDATEFGYRVASSFQTSRYTSTEPVCIDHPPALHSNTTYSGTVNTLGANFVSSSYMNNPEEIIASQKEWDSLLEGEDQKPRQEFLKEDPYLVEYEGMQRSMQNLYRAGDAIFDENFEDDWEDAVCELDF
mmetsp:Transcript_7298/g.9519  ORF Transcript_7298/g.9519 Transcript_7298/m.9519 type:complete len:188 (+) Transcript_7298:109-672(+)|eukprot:CAMPEP_0198143174 /NCGR_PEP_ID=MMETSP1443-20131203/5921_1 /TAXON_ID=186043 /ORGANISM="Entomoneis sp., Strain CCMP2396" /LENGTH=187 /DNA_ID=CAMNT_0043806345 /DNA_START=61 /DNA_END=624 /DNA_ORIENTATION=-